MIRGAVPEWDCAVACAGRGARVGSFLTMLLHSCVLGSASGGDPRYGACVASRSLNENKNMLVSSTTATTNSTLINTRFPTLCYLCIAHLLAYRVIVILLVSEYSHMCVYT